MIDIAADIRRLEELDRELGEMGQRIKIIIPQSDDRYEPTQTAHQFIGQAGSGCYQAARYLRMAAKAALGGE